MKPPPRVRNKPARSLRDEPERPGPGPRWQRTEERKLLSALRGLSRTDGGRADIDYEFLKKQLPARSTAEIQNVVDSLKDKVISRAIPKLKKKRWEENKSRKPIEVWTHMASAVAGTLEEPITSAFSQMLIVSSTEPRTLRNCDPPQVRRTPKDHDRPVGQTIPLRPMSCLPAGGVRPGASSARPFLILRTPAPTVGPTKRLPALSKVLRIPNSKTPPPQQQLSSTAAPPHCPGTADRPAAPPLHPQSGISVSGQATLPSASNAEEQSQGGGCVVQTAQQHPAATSTPAPPSTFISAKSSTTPSSPHTSVTHPMATPPRIAPGPSLSPWATASLLPVSSPAAAAQASLSHSSKFTPVDSVSCSVDFERIYGYLSVAHQPTEECRLPPMESAIMLDLLMSLPDELPLLDCTSLREHLVQVYQSLSAPADSQVAREMLKDLKERACAQSEGSSSAAGTRPGSQLCSDRTDGGAPVDNAAMRLQPGEAESQSSQSHISSQSGKVDMRGLCPPSTLSWFH